MQSPPPAGAPRTLGTGPETLQHSAISNQSVFLEITDVFNVMVPCALLIGAGIGFVGSMITIKKHLKV